MRDGVTTRDRPPKRNIRSRDTVFAHLAKNKKISAFPFFSNNTFFPGKKKTEQHSGLNVIGAPRDRERDTTHEFGAGISLNDTTPRNSMDGGKRPLRAEHYPTGRNSLDLNKADNALGALYRQDVKTQELLEKNGVSAFI